MMWLRRAVVAAVVCLVPLAAAAHPLGNFTTNQYLGVHLEPEQVTLDYVVDLAEIPASQQRRVIDVDADDRISAAEEAGFVSSGCRARGESLTVDLGGEPLVLAGGAGALVFPPGEAGLATLRLECRFTAPLDLAGPVLLRVENSNFPDRLGWSEITLSGHDADADTDLPTASATRRLTEYPDDVLASPADVRVGSALIRPAAGNVFGAAPPPLGAAASRSTPVDALAALVDPGGAPALPLAIAVALGLGALHALAPGHGKTVMAAYLVGSGGNRRQALGLGLSVAVSHTLGVLVLGLVTLAGTSTFAPERVFPVLSLLSGVIVIGIGGWMLLGWARRRGAHHHHHHDDHSHPHSHGGVPHTHALPASLEGKAGWKVLATVGLAGGLVPSTSALVLLLAAVNLGRIPLGILLIALFGVGMAVTLVGVGLGLATATRSGLSRLSGGGWVGRFRQSMTPAAAVAVMVVGGVLTANAM